MAMNDPKGPKHRRPTSNKPWHPKGVQTRNERDSTVAGQMRLDAYEKKKGKKKR